MVNVRVEMPRTSCHLSIFSLGQRGFQLGLATGRSRRTTLPPARQTFFLFSVTPYRGVAFNNRVFCTGGGYADVFDLCDFPMRS